MKGLCYTFRTFHFLPILKEVFPEIHVLGKLKLDIEKFCTRILESNPDYILGIAYSRKGSFFERKAINQFNSWKIEKSSIEEFILNIPKKPRFKLSKKPTTSFCNYSMYRIKYFLKKNNLNIPFSFVHLNEKDINLLKQLQLCPQ
ncbi:MAG TPA: hypothetical protein VJB06_01790 [archaeon]|nr:hypothetical protein [archaeon]